MWLGQQIAQIRSGWLMFTIGLFVALMTLPTHRAGGADDAFLTTATALGLATYIGLMCLPILYRRRFSLGDLFVLASGGEAIALIGDLTAQAPWQAVIGGIFILIFMASILFSGPRFNR